MKILFCHNFYQQPGGEDIAMVSEMDLLKSHGHDVHLYSVSNDIIKTIWQKLITGFQLTYSIYHKTQLKKIIKELKPDIVHVHNFFPLLTPSIFDACNEMDTPVVHSLHNYRLLCPSATLYTNGKNNEESLTHSPYRMIKHKAYKNSYLATFLLARAIKKYKNKKIWENSVSQFIAPSLCLKNIYIQGGFPPEKITVKSNFVNSDYLTETNVSSDPNKRHCIDSKKVKPYAIFIGRLVHEKGIKTLLESWRKNDIDLKVYGSGPLKSLCESINQNNIHYLGEVNRTDAVRAISNSHYLIMPTQWQEPFGIVAIEALAMGIPVIASRIGAMPEIITHNKNGLLFSPNNKHDLQKQIDIMKSNKQRNKMSTMALTSFQKKYSADINYQQLLMIYNQAIQRKTDIAR